MKKNYLLTPGPTPIPPEVYAAMNMPIIHHRTPQFQTILKEVEESLRYVFQTKNQVYIFTSSGTGAMEAGVVNFLSEKETVLTVESGKFGERWTEICKSYNLNTEIIKVEPGKAVNPTEVERRLKDNPQIKAVFTTLCETSTGVTHDIQTLGKIVKETAAILVVDAISGLGAIPLYTDDWFCDVVVSGSQKGLMIPPGLSFITVSKKAENLMETSNLPKYYFDLKEAKKAWKSIDTPFTPAITLIIGLRQALELIKQEGLEKIFKKHKKLADAVRAAVKALGLELFADTSCASDAITAVKVPEGIDGEKLVKIMRDNYGVTIAGGQSELKGKIFRIAHMGYIEEFDIIVGIACLEKVLAQLGYKFNLGAGLKAAQEVLLKE